MSATLTSPYLAAFAIPLSLIAGGALVKKIVRGAGWRRSDFFLGPELVLAALGAAMVYLVDVPDSTAGSYEERWEDVAVTLIFIGISFLLLLFIMSTHQDWEHRTANRRGQVFWLGLVCNGLAIALFFSFVLLVNGAS
jgi:hypothetical protein